MMHPQDYTNADKTIDENSYDKYYIAMLKYFSEMGVVFVTFEDLKNNRTPPS